MQKSEMAGYKIILEGTWYEITNKYGVLESGDAAVDEEDIPEDYAKRKLDRFIRDHTPTWAMSEGKIQRVAFDEKTGKYIQLQVLRTDWTDELVVQEFDNELIFMREQATGCKFKHGVLDWLKEHYKIEKCLTAHVYKNPMGDCTNYGISARQDHLYILNDKNGPFEPSDIRQCVCIEKRTIIGKEYVDCKPAYRPKAGYMFGGNFLYTSDSRFAEITGIDYPIAIHDRCEW